MRNKVSKSWKSIKNNIVAIGLWILTFIVSVVAFSSFHLKSLRGSVSDSITISSIILAILGVLLSMIISMNEDSEFVKRARQYKVEKHIMNKLFKRIMMNFELNIFIIIFTLLYDVAPSMSNVFVKNGVNALWCTLFFGSIYEVLFIVKLIGRIYLFKSDKIHEQFET
ncbi:hypothetical protein VZM76_02880 [Lactiplantibacillus plantarum]|uniref:hypothetical protein n=1 Tax=Lactiplantibacillus plantarum TaxID=1590 RepID=UPI001C7D97C9|nr:hypothetical protein [Lactiplantibacillus plantarum]MBX4155655.1 hypothetical protein [Lactiplantibacillus plantarum]WVI02672.1 hypothetical protein VZM76_02880 [Lactiplantibacillus plantarum]